MRVVEERKIYNFVEGNIAKKWADPEEINETVTLSAEGETLTREKKQSLSWIRIPTLSSAPILTKSFRIFQECYLKKFTTKTCKKNRSKEEDKFKNRNCRKSSGRVAAADKNHDFSNLWSSFCAWFFICFAGDLEQGFCGGRSWNAWRDPEKQNPEAVEDAAENCRFRTHEHPELQNSSMAWSR